jgi:ABC-type arginine/histidine transport system permease subunit
MSTKQKAVLYTLAIVILSLIIILTISVLVHLIGSSVSATVLSILVWTYIVYKITSGYLGFLKEVE